MRTVSWLVAIAAVVAAGAVCFEVETIVGTCPALGVLGITLALLAARGRRTGYLVWGLSEAIVTAALALTIAVFRLSPGEAAAPACIALIVNAIASLAICWRLSNQPAPASSQIYPPGQAVFTQFSVRTLLIATTVCCVLLAVARLIPWRVEMVCFAAYGLAMTAISAFIAVRYAYRRLEARPLITGIAERTEAPPAESNLRHTV
jgi:hypothetical protein